MKYVKYFTIVIISLSVLSSGVVFFVGKSKSVSVQKASLCPSPVGETVVTVSDQGYSPNSFTVKRCTKVTFRNTSSIARWPASNPHPTHDIYPQFDPTQRIFPGEAWSFVFDRVGRWGYHDHLTPSIRGIITVVE
jgi:plastocyanin